MNTLSIATLATSYDIAKKAARRSEWTRVLDADSIGRLVEWLEIGGRSTAAGDIDVHVLREYFAHLADHLAASTCAIHYRHLRAFWGWMVREEEIDVNPFARLREPKPEDRPPELLSEADLRALLKVVDGRGFVQRRDRAIILTLIDAGPRLGELVSMTTEGISTEWQTVAVAGKTLSRALPLGDTAWQALDRYMRSRRDHRLAHRAELWVGEKGPLTTSGIQQMLRRRGRQAGVDHVHPHRFRHTWAHMWLAAGGNESDLQRLAGWSSPAMVAVYGRSAAEGRAREAHRALSPADRLTR